MDPLIPNLLSSGRTKKRDEDPVTAKTVQITIDSTLSSFQCGLVCVVQFQKRPNKAVDDDIGGGRGGEEDEKHLVWLQTDWKFFLADLNILSGKEGSRNEGEGSPCVAFTGLYGLLYAEAERVYKKNPKIKYRHFPY